jgi:O-antigen biosynthesis protein WbqP
VKRQFDFVIALFGLAVLWPLILVLALGVYLDSGTPAFFKQQRVGRFQKHFTCLKLRSMPQSTRSVPSHDLKNIVVSKFGHFLRRYKLDELPQLFNVLIGQMSLVGPRPCLPQQHELISLRSAHGVFGLRPGITGYAQVHNVDMSDPTRLVMFEKTYMDRASFLVDLKILIATLSGRGLRIDAAKELSQ